MPGLGRLVAPDARDRAFPMAAHLPAEAARQVLRRTWRRGPVLDQGQTSECVAFAWTQWLATAPPAQAEPTGWPDVLYHQAQAVDEWAGTAHDGTTVRAGAKAMAADGFLGQYVWAASVEDVVSWLLTKGPVVLGTNWHEAMFTPDKTGLVKPGGAVAGGHAYLAIGADRRHGLVRCVNSWGAGWGLGGEFLISVADLAALLAQDGEACTGIEAKTKGAK